MVVGTLTVCAVSGSASFWFVAACLAGAVTGPFLFFSGFRMLRYKRKILDTPISKIHSAAIGLVEVLGMPTGPQTLTAPVSGDDCYYYRVQAWQWRETGGSGNGHEWKEVMDESCYVPFFLQDSTGRVLIDPQGAEMDVHRSFSDEISASYFRTRDLLPSHIRDFLVKRGQVPYEKIKIEEHVIQPAYPLFVFGTLGDNPGHVAWTPQPQVASRKASSVHVQLNVAPGFGITWRTPATGSQVVPEHAAAIMSPVGAPLPAAVLAGPAPLGAAAEENPRIASDPSFELHPSAAICKGQHGDPYTISCRSQKEVVESLAWKSTLYIWGGPVLGMVCLYLLLLYWKLLSS